MRYRLLGTWCCCRYKLFHVEQFGFYGMPAVGAAVHSPPARNCSTWNNLAHLRIFMVDAGLYLSTPPRFGRTDKGS